MSQARNASQLRWAAMLAFTLAPALSYLDRNLLVALQPALREEFGLTGAEYGLLISAFSITYAAAAPLAGALIDRAGLTLGICSLVGLWSLAAIATGFTSTFRGLLTCRVSLGLMESGTFPGNGKASGLYLLPSERALGSAMAQIGITLGMASAPLLATAASAVWGWRSAFVIAGALGFVWIPLWILVSRFVPPANPVAIADQQSPVSIWRDRRMWSLAAANMLVMAPYSLWSSWTTPFLVTNYGLGQNEVNLRMAWIPPVFAAIGGLTGGFLSLHLARRQRSLLSARVRSALIAGVALLLTIAAPHLPNATLATAAICWSFFWVVAYSSNVYAIPVDYFGAGGAASAVSLLTFSYGLMQTVVSVPIGWMMDRYGFGPVCAIVGIGPLAAWLILHRTVREA